MTTHPVIKKLQYKDPMQLVLILQAPESYKQVIAEFPSEVDSEISKNEYGFIQIFGTSNDSIKVAANRAISHLSEDGLLWLCYPKKSSKTYKGSDCSRETVGSLIADLGFEPVSQVAVDEDWSALRFRQVDKIKTMTRGFAYTEAGKERTKK